MDILEFIWIKANAPPWKIQMKGSAENSDEGLDLNSSELMWRRLFSLQLNLSFNNQSADN